MLLLKISDTDPYCKCQGGPGVVDRDPSCIDLPVLGVKILIQPVLLTFIKLTKHANDTDTKVAMCVRGLNIFLLKWICKYWMNCQNI